MVSIPTSRKGMVSPVLAVSLGIVTVACVAAVYLMNAQYQQQNADLQKRLDTAVAELKALQTATPAATATPQATASASASPTASASAATLQESASGQLSGSASVTGYLTFDTRFKDPFEEAGDSMQYAFFQVTSTNSTVLTEAMKSKKDNSFYNESAIGIGCVYNSSSKVVGSSITGADLLTLSGTTYKTLSAATASNPVTAVVTIAETEGGRTPTDNCFTNVSKLELQ